MTHTKLDFFDHVAASIFVLDLDNDGVPRYAVWNSAAESETGLARDTVIGKTARDIFPAPRGETEYQRHLAAARTGDALTYDINCGSGDMSTWQRTTLKPSLPRSPRRIVGTSIDVSAQYHLRRLQKDSTSLNSEAEQFVTLAAHDLCAPMRNIASLTEMLREDFVDQGDGKLGLIDMLEEVANSSAALLKDVLSHAQSVNAAPELVSFDLDHLCKSLCDVLDPRSLHRITWSKMTLFGDKTAFQIVLRNLLDNAIKHGKKAHMSINFDVQQSAFDTITIKIQDDGLGFQNTRPVFDESGSFRTGQGYGLFSVRRLLKARGGNIRVQDTADQEGCVISFSLPGNIISGNPDVHIPSSNARKTG